MVKVTFSLITVIFLINGCKTFDDYDKLQKKVTSFRLNSISDDFDANRKTDAEYNYIYNKKGYLSKIEYDYLADGTKDLIYKYDFYKNDYLKSAKIDYNADGKYDLVYNYVFKNNMLSKIEYDYNNDSNIDFIYSYEYNDKNLLKSYKIEATTKGITIINNFNDDYFNKSKYFCNFGVCLDFVKFPKNSPENLDITPYTNKGTVSNYSSIFNKGDIEYILTITKIAI